MNLGGTLRTKLLVLAFVPAAAVAYLSGGQILEAAAARSSDERLEQLCQFSVLTGNLLHEMQKERGTSAVYMSSKGKKFIGELPEQRKQTDAARVAYEEFRNLHQSELPAGVRANIDFVAAELQKLGHVRKNTSSLIVPLGEIVGFYSRTNAKLLKSVGALGKATQNAYLTRRVAAYLALLEAKERSGIERAQLAAAFGRGNFAPGQLINVASLIAKMQAYLKTFESHASESLLQIFKDKQAHPAVAKVADFEKQALSKADGENLGIDSTEWFGVMTQRINLLKEVENATADSLIHDAKAAASKASSALAGLGVLVLIIAGLTVILTVRTMRSVLSPIKAMITRLQDIAEGEGDLTQRVCADARDEIGELGRWFNTFIEKIEHTVAQSKRISRQVFDSNDSILAGSQDVANSASNQASNLEQVSASIKEMSTIAKSNAEVSTQAQDLSSSTVESAEDGHGAMERLSGAMVDIRASGDKIGEIIKVINDIAFQTNLLALNAAVEAARAGDSGKGFAVVAEEVRNLAQRSAEAARSTGELIGEASERAERGATISQQVGEVLNTIVGNSREAGKLMDGLSASIAEQSDGIDRVNEALRNLDGITQTNAGASEELATTVSTSHRDLSLLQDNLNAFHVEEKT